MTKNRGWLAVAGLAGLALLLGLTTGGDGR